VIGVLTCIVVSNNVKVILKGPSTVQRLEGFGKIVIACPIGAISLYIGYLLLRYPEIRRTNAAEIMRLAKRQRIPLSPLSMEK
jgi:hypothetical protein